jgi:hypothetical protein
MADAAVQPQRDVEDGARSWTTSLFKPGIAVRESVAFCKPWSSGRARTAPNSFPPTQSPALLVPAVAGHHSQSAPGSFREDRGRRRNLLRFKPRRRALGGAGSRSDLSRRAGAPGSPCTSPSRTTRSMSACWWPMAWCGCSRSPPCVSLRVHLQSAEESPAGPPSLEACQRNKEFAVAPGMSLRSPHAASSTNRIFTVLPRACRRSAVVCRQVRPASALERTGASLDQRAARVLHARADHLLADRRVPSSVPGAIHRARIRVLAPRSQAAPGYLLAFSNLARA